MKPTKIKRSGSRLDYDVDYSKWLPDGDVVVSATATSEDPTEMPILATLVTSGETVKVWLEGGNDRESYDVLVLATTAGGRILEYEFTIRIKD